MQDVPAVDDDVRSFAREVLAAEADAVRSLIDTIDDGFAAAVQLLLDLPGSAVTTGVGKAGHVARKCSATLASTGTPSHFLSPGDALHGDLGSVRRGDAVLFFSASGETDELVRLLDAVRRLGRPTVAICAGRASSLGEHADVVVPMGRVAEACPLKLAPSCSTTAMLALADALALSVMRQRNFTADDFAVFHPAGQLGRKLLRVEEAMSFRADENLPTAQQTETVGDVLQRVSRIPRRPGAVVVTDADRKLVGVFSDGDLRRLIVRDAASALTQTIGSVMTRRPKHLQNDALASDAVAIMRAHRIDELPVVDAAGVVAGLIDVQDLVVLRLFDEDRSAAAEAR
jgi:arabinose-5-phosphate isomerase